MATYKLSSDGTHRTDGYRFTVSSKTDKDLLALKENVKRYNKRARDYIRAVYNNFQGNPPHGYGMEILRVTLMARGPRAKFAVADYGFARAYDQTLPHKYAQTFDVYCGVDSYAMTRLEYELENGLTPGQHAIIDREQRKVWDADNKMLAALGAAGISRVGDRNGTRFVNSATHSPRVLRRR